MLPLPHSTPVISLTALVFTIWPKRSIRQTELSWRIHSWPHRQWYHKRLSCQAMTVHWTIMKVRCLTLASSRSFSTPLKRNQWKNRWITQLISQIAKKTMRRSRWCWIVWLIRALWSQAHRLSKAPPSMRAPINLTDSPSWILLHLWRKLLYRLSTSRRFSSSRGW